MTPQMKAGLLYGINDLRLQEINKPVVRPGTILLKIHASAICGSDLRIFKHGNPRVNFPAIIGHEASAEIVEVGKNVEAFKIGERVALGADIPCGRCGHCQEGRGNCCDNNYALGYQFPGAFAEYCLLEPMMVNYGSIIKIPTHVSYEQAALMEPLACILNGFELAKMEVGKSVLIIGSGPIGCLAIMAAQALGASTVLVSDVNHHRLKQAEKFNANACLDSSREDFIKRINELTNNQGVDRVFTMCPSVDAQELAVKVVAKRGYVNFFGGLPKESRPAQIFSNLIHYKECYIMGSHGSTPRQNRLAMDLISSGKVKVEKVITHRFPLTEIQQGFNAMESLDGLKIIISPNNS